ncbi:hypothetical protein DWU98_08725 [Dyella monticola]|uniref:Uncharacterized protein n=2 Tax=Dyella monticola TaxID=1927958 RepID=A0A370X140_9GAMM|nr:hypothetical protein DWU98_08725 [Dyella monticola]
MDKLFNRSNFSDGDKAAIKRGFDGTLRDLEQNKREGARRLIIGYEGGPNSPSAVAFNDGTISFSRYAVNTMRPADLRELTVHEHTHTGAGTADHWYLTRNHDRFPNWGGNLSPFTFQNAVNNADTLARSSSVLESNV